MKEYKVGERIVLEVQEGINCKGCFFYYKGCKAPIFLHCSVNYRGDDKSIIYKQIEP